MQVIPTKGYILVSIYEPQEEKKSLILLASEPKKKGYVKVEMAGQIYLEGQVLLPHPYKEKIQIDETFFQSCEILSKEKINKVKIIIIIIRNSRCHWKKKIDRSLE